MSYIADNCTFGFYTKDVARRFPVVTCGDEDLDEFFSYDAFLQQKELLCKNFFFYEGTTDNGRIVAVFTLSNDSIKKIPNNRKKKIEKNIDRNKHYFSYPAVMIGRLGVSTEFQNRHIGGEILDFIKAWFLDPLNKTGCRFLLVDSYKTERNLHFYERNGFEYLFGSEEQEKEFRGMNPERELKTRLMYFDLKVLVGKDDAHNDTLK